MAAAQCKSCQARPATYARPAKSLKRRARRDHDLCGSCWRDLCMSQRARAGEIPQRQPTWSDGYELIELVELASGRLVDRRTGRSI